MNKKFKVNYPSLLIVAAFSLALVIATLPGQAQTNRQQSSYREEMEEKVAAEMERRSRVLQWARTRNPSQRDIFFRLNQPLIEGNRADFDRNMRLAEQFRERANTARQNRQEEIYRRHMATAQAFRQLAECNRMIFEGITDGKQEQVDEAYRKIPELEAIIAEQTRRRPTRDWVTPQEMRRYRPRPNQ